MKLKLMISLFSFRVKLHQSELLLPVESLKLSISMKAQLNLSSNRQKMTAAHLLRNTSLNSVTRRLVNGIQSRRFQQIRKTTRRLRKKSERRRRSRLRSTDSMRETTSNSVFAPRTRAVSEKLVTPLTFTRFARRR